MVSAAASVDDAIHALHIEKNIDIPAPIEIAWESLIEEMGPGGEMPGGVPFSMVLEAWPGGRWYRDLGDNAGHFWGHVQVIKPPKLLEICGPMFMSYAAISHVQYRLTEDGKSTKLKLTHKAVGLITQEHREGVDMGWQHVLDKVVEIAKRLNK